MPIYEYRCPKCSSRFEVIYIRFGEEGKAVCPNCGFAEPERVLSRFHLRGPARKTGEGGTEEGEGEGMEDFEDFDELDDNGEDWEEESPTASGTEEAEEEEEEKEEEEEEKPESEDEFKDV